MQQDDNQKNLLIAIVLSVGVLFFWQMFYAGPKLKDEQARREREKQVATQPVDASGRAPGIPAPPSAAGPGSDAAPGAPPRPGAGGVPTPVATAAMARDSALAASPRVSLDTPSLRGSVALKGARLDDIVLTHYRETARKDSPNVVLFSPAGSDVAYFAEHGWSVAAGSTVKVPTGDTLWQAAAGASLTPQRPLQLTWDNGEGLVFRRTISVDDRYMFKIVDAVENRGTAEVVLYPFARVFRYGTPKLQGFFILHEGLLGVLDEKLREIGYADSATKGGGLTVEKTTGGWLGFTDKYWSAALIPDQKIPFRANLQGFERRGSTAESYQTDYLKEAVVVPAGGLREVQAHLFAGAKEVKVIEGYQTALGVGKFDLMIDWGWFYFITKPLFWMIHWFSEVFKNFGLAILAVTVVVKLAFFPLANKSYESMAKMKKLQPEMEKLRERYKDDATRMREELMKLYQKEKINPAAGCLPILLQIPVFFALYKVLFVTIDMRHAPFFGWVHDLSAPDPTTIFNLFGLLPFNPGAVPLLGEFLMVGIWPLIMGVTMFVQMQLNPQQPDPMQQKIFNWMPVLFTFLLASFPVGLVIYWAWNNVLSLLQQYWIMRRNGADIHLWKNLGIEKWMSGKGGSKA